jgi:hypothetical protein
VQFVQFSNLRFSGDRESGAASDGNATSFPHHAFSEIIWIGYQVEALLELARHQLIIVTRLLGCARVIFMRGIELPLVQTGNAGSFTLEQYDPVLIVMHAEAVPGPQTDT